MAPIFGYWNIRGLGQPIRLLLNYLGIQYIENRYDLKFQGEAKDNEWLKVKFTLGLDFPNLPYYIDDDVKLTQSMVILRYIGSKHGLDGNGNVENARIRMLEFEVLDHLYAFWKLAHDPDFKQKVDTVMEEMAIKLKCWSKVLGEKEFIMGKITTADFLLYEFLYRMTDFRPSTLEPLENLRRYKTRFEEIPNIKKYLMSADYIEFPIFSYNANFGKKPRELQSEPEFKFKN